MQPEPPEPGQLLKGLRVERGWSQSSLAGRLQRAAEARGQQVGINAQMISRWENGHRTPDEFYRELLHETLGLAPTRWEEDVDRREFLQLAGTATATVAGAPGTVLFELHRTLRPAGVDDGLLDELSADVRHLHRSYAARSPHELLQVIEQRLTFLTRLLQEPQPVHVRRHLCWLGGEVAGLRAWLSFDLGDPRAADRWYELALSMAGEAQHHNLAGWILGARSLLPTAAGDPGKALSHVDRALDLTPKGGRTATAAWLHALAARAAAGTGETDAAHEHLDAALTSRLRVDADEHRHGLDVEDGELALAYYEGTTLKLTDDHSGALHALDAAQEVVDNLEHQRAQSVIMLEKAEVHVRDEHPDEAAALASRALELPEEDLIGPIEQRVRTVRRELEPWRAAPAVRDLDERLLTIYG